MERPVRPWWVRALGLALLGLALAVYGWWPMLASYPATQTWDGIISQHYIEVARVSVTRWHELPLWDPFQCSGLPYWDNPTTFAASPIVWLSVFIGSTRTVHAWIVIHVAMGFIGMWLLCRHELGLRRSAAFVAAGAFAFCGVHTQHLTVGHLPFAGFLWFPLALFLWKRAERDTRFAVGLGMLLALMFYEGAVYPLPMLLVVLAAEALTRAWPPRRVLVVTRAGLVVGVVAFTLAASRLLPVFYQLALHERRLWDVDALRTSDVVDMFLRRVPPPPDVHRMPGLTWAFHEYGAYLGMIVLGFAFLGILVQGRQKVWMLPLLGFSFALMLGQVGHLAPYAILHAHVPPFKQMRVPSRWCAWVAVFFAAYAGIAVEQISGFLERHVRGGRGRVVSFAVVALAMVGVGDVIGVGIADEPVWFTSPPSSPGPTPVRLFYADLGTAPPLIDVARQNRMRFECERDEWAFGMGVYKQLWTGDVPQARPVGDEVVVEVANRTPNTFTVDVDAKHDGARILVNSTYDPGWRTDVGKTVDVGQQLAVELPAGRSRVHLRYWPRGMTAGILLSVLGVLGTLAYWLAVTGQLGPRLMYHPRARS